MYKQWSSFPDVQQIVHTELVTREDGPAQKNHIQIDIILGTFLVNGMPITSLPDEIANHRSFRRIFGATCFEVQPTCSGSFCTVFKYNDCTYYFKIEMKQLIVTEVRADGDVFEMIPGEKFGDDVSNFIINKNI